MTSLSNTPWPPECSACTWLCKLWKSEKRRQTCQTWPIQRHSRQYSVCCPDPAVLCLMIFTSKIAAQSALSSSSRGGVGGSFCSLSRQLNSTLLKCDASSQCRSMFLGSSGSNKCASETAKASFEFVLRLLSDREELLKLPAVLPSFSSSPTRTLCRVGFRACKYSEARLRLSKALGVQYGVFSETFLLPKYASCMEL